jgi:hypothetical protein
MLAECDFAQIRREQDRFMVTRWGISGESCLLGYSLLC